MTGRLAPSSGQIWLHGQRIDGKKPFEIGRLGLSRSFQISNIFPRLTVLDNLRCSLLWSGGCGYAFWRFLSQLHDVNARARLWLERLSLADQGDTLAADLTYAQQRALELGMTLAGGAGVVLLDEPTAGMSRSETAHFVGLIREVTQGRTLLIVEHDMGVVFDLADRIAVLSGGGILALDRPEAVRANAQVQAAYLGRAPSGDRDAAH